MLIKINYFSPLAQINLQTKIGTAKSTKDTQIRHRFSTLIAVIILATGSRVSKRVLSKHTRTSRLTDNGGEGLRERERGMERKREREREREGGREGERERGISREGGREREREYSTCTFMPVQ